MVLQSLLDANPLCRIMVIQGSQQVNCGPQLGLGPAVALPQPFT
jgi:hypothetical protein